MLLIVSKIALVKFCRKHELLHALQIEKATSTSQNDSAVEFLICNNFRRWLPAETKSSVRCNVPSEYFDFFRILCAIASAMKHLNSLTAMVELARTVLHLQLDIN